MLPIVYESIDGDWRVVVQADAPAGYVSTPGALNADVTTSTMGAVQFTVHAPGAAAQGLVALGISNGDAPIAGNSGPAAHVGHRLTHRGATKAVTVDTEIVDKRKK